MTRVLLAALAAALLCVFPLSAEDKPKDKPVDKPAEKKERAEQLKDLRSDLQKAMPDIRRAYFAASTPAEKKKAVAKLDPIADSAYKIVEENPKDDVAYDALMFVVNMYPPEGVPVRALNYFLEYHRDNSKLAPRLLGFAGNTSDSVINFLNEVAQKSANKEIKGTALLAAGQSVHQKAEDSKDQKESSRLFKQAEDLVERVIKEFGDVSIGAQTLKEQAKKTLFEIRNLSIGKTVPEVVSKDLDDKEVKLTSLRGKVVVIDIWATWCGPCRAMIPHEREMVEKLKDKPFVLISISADEKKETLKEFLEKEKMPWTHWWEGRREGGIVNDWNVRFFPTIYLIDHKGVIRHKGLRGKPLEEAVEKLLEEMQKKS